MQIYIIIGPSGVGKTTIGKMLSERLNVPFYDADDFHSPANIDKMRLGNALGDEDRGPWLNTLSDNIKSWHADEGAVLACSALKEEYRKKLMAIPEQYTTWIYLHGDQELIGSRLSGREEHFFNKNLLNSQYKDLEVPEYGCHVSVNKAPEEVVEDILYCIRKKEGI